MNKFLLKEIITNNITDELEQIGFDNCYINKAQDKYRYKNVKIYDLTIAQANILKQTALSCGSDCGVHREVITGKVDKTDVILTGSISHLKKIAQRLKSQPFKLGTLADEILEFIAPRKSSTKLAGVLNVTPDSFSDGGEYYNPNDAIKHLLQLIEDEADMIDIGAESTKPFSKPVPAKEQIRRLKPVLEFIQKEKIQIPISIDTRSSETADFALNYGASFINDVSGFEYDKKLAEIVASYNAGVIIQHSQGTPENMQNSPKYNHLIEEIYTNLKMKSDYAKNLGINEIIVDPGIGFGKTQENNFEILNRIEEFYGLKLPVMVGVSRKSLLGIKENNNELKDSLSAAISYPLIQRGVDFLRVHNVKLHKYLIKLNKKF